VGSGNITGIVVNCGTNTYTVGGTVSGLEGTLTLRNNGGDALTLAPDFNGSYTFATPLTSGAAYNVSLGAHSALPVQTCSVQNPSGSVGSANITNANISCTTATFTVGGSVTGLGGGTIQLTNNGTDIVSRSVDGTFTFGTVVASGHPYDVKVSSLPAGKACPVTFGSGSVGSTNVNNVQVSCFQAIAFSENFDSVTGTLPTGWVSTVLVGSGAISPFVLSNTTADTAPNDVFASEGSQASDVVLASPAFTVSTSQATLTFRHSFDLEASGVDPGVAYDGAMLEISINGGAYTDFVAAGGTFTSGGPTRTISSSFQNPLGGRLAWSKGSGGYMTTTANLPASAAGQQVHLRFRMGTDKQNVVCPASAPCVGWRIDSIVVKN
jgi:hypothetical protein